MNKIVFEHYPVSKLPADLRAGLGENAKVRVVIEVDEPAKGDAIRNLEALLWKRSQNPASFSGNVTIEEAVARIRELRDEWDDK
jgi:hypothetical protein